MMPVDGMLARLGSGSRYEAPVGGTPQARRLLAARAARSAATHTLSAVAASVSSNTDDVVEALWSLPGRGVCAKAAGAAAAAAEHYRQTVDAASHPACSPAARRAVGARMVSAAGASGWAARRNEPQTGATARIMRAAARWQGPDGAEILAANNPLCPAALLVALSDSEDEDASYVVAGNPSSPQMLIKRFAAHPTPGVRGHAAANPACQRRSSNASPVTAALRFVAKPRRTRRCRRSRRVASPTMKTYGCATRSLCTRDARLRRWSGSAGTQREWFARPPVSSANTARLLRGSPHPNGSTLWGLIPGERSVCGLLRIRRQGRRPCGASPKTTTAGSGRTLLSTPVPLLRYSRRCAATTTSRPACRLGTTRTAHRTRSQH